MESDQSVSPVEKATNDNINIGIIVLDHGGFIVQWNHWMEKYSGYSKSHVLGKSLKAVFPELVNQRFFSAISQAINSGSSSLLAQSIHKSPLPLFDQNKVRIDQAIEIHPLKTGTQKEFHCLVQISDVSLAVRREKQLRQNALDLSQLVNEISESESMTNAIIAISGDGMVKISEDGLIECLSPRAEEIFGYQREDVLGLSVTEFLAPAYAEQAQSFLKQFARHSTLMGMGEWRILEARRKNGEIIPVNLNLITTKHFDKRQIICMVRDLSEIEASQRALQESNHALELALDCADQWMWNWQVDSGIVYLDRMMQMLGYEKGSYESSVKTWRDLVHPEDWPEVNMKMRQHLDGYSSSFDCEYRLLKASGDWMWVHDQGKVIARDREGNALRVIGINQNITRRKLAEIDAKDATDKALEAARVKSDFLGNMSHELRTPMNGVMGVLNILSLSDMTEEQMEYIGVAKRSAESLLKMIDNVLDFSKLNAKSVQLELISFDPEEILEDIVKLLSESAKEKGLLLDYSIEQSMQATGKITTDPDKLRQVLINLAGNAIKFTQEGFVQIRLLKHDHKHVLFEIEDSGIGIPLDRQEVIFDAFTQADISTTRKYGGTGLGLGISKELVELMGGQILVESVVGKGSVFSFTVEDHTPEEQKMIMLNNNDHQKELA